MPRFLSGLLLVFTQLLSGSNFCLAQDTEPNGIYIVFDGSGSMWQKLPDKTFKIEAAKKVLQEFVASDFSGSELALRVYGHRRKGDCRDSELAIPFASPQTVMSRLADFMANVNPTGKTPITYSFRQALRDFGDRPGEIILISDGIETCDEDPCALMKEWRERNVRIRVHVVGLGLDEKSKHAMRCISEAAGTEYYDANSASELADGLKKIHQQTTSIALKIRGFDAEGKSLKIKGTLSKGGAQVYEVGSHQRNIIEPGEYELTAGVATRNGGIYKPVTRTITVAAKGETVVDLNVAVPPTVKAEFIQRGKKQPGSQVTAYQNGKEVFAFRAQDRVYLDEGSYEFRAQPNPENDLSVMESFVAGDSKAIVFEMVHTVRAKFKLVAAGSGIWFRQNYELWQNGKKVINGHVRNGARVLPGAYDLRLPSTLTPFTKEGIVITSEDDQYFEIEVQVGHVTVVYRKADGAKDKDDRCFIAREGSRKRTYKISGEKHPLPPGIYTVAGWGQKGDYDPVVFEIETGKDIEVVLRAKK